MHRFTTGRSLLALGPVLALGLAACSIEIEFGEVSVQTYEVEPFDRIDIGGAFEVDVTVGEATSVEIETGENIHENLDVRVEDGELKIDLDRISILGDGPMRATITTPSLVRLDLSGASEAEVTGVDADRFELDVSGASVVEIDGSLARLDLDASGASSVDLGSVEIETANIDLSGASNADLRSAGAVTGDLSGASSLDVDSGTTVDVETSGASSIDR